MKFIIALWYGKLINKLVNLIDKSRGSNVAGQHAMKIDPEMIRHFKGIDPEKVLFITGTNGKSTTNNLINHVLTTNGKKVVTNLEGANLIWGVTTALIKASTLSGRVDADYYVFETDERYIGLIREQLPACNVLITNLQKDQVQRNGDPDFIMRKFAKMMDGAGMRMFLNNEEPRSRGFDRFASKVVTYGAEKHSRAFMKGPSYVTMPCPKCHHRISFDFYNNDGVGQFHCTHCGNASQPEADYCAKNADFEGRTFTIDGVPFTMPLNNPHMLYNYAATAAVAKEMAGISIEDTAKSFETFHNIGGRDEVLHYQGKTITYMRIKQENPETLQTILNIIAADPREKMVVLGFGTVSDFTPYYSNTFYTYDCDWSRIEASHVESYYCFTEDVCCDSANRLIYEGVDPSKIIIEDTDSNENLFRAIGNAKTDTVYMITKLHSFESMEKYIEEHEGGR